jgi:hypothetical protein
MPEVRAYPVLRSMSELPEVHGIGAAVDVPVERLGYLPMAQELVETMYVAVTESSAWRSHSG